MTVALRELVASDAAWCDTWLAPLGASAGCDDMRTVADLVAWAHRARTATAAVLVRDGEPVGVAAWRAPARPSVSGMIELVALPAANARRGTGMEAAAIVESVLREHGAKRVYAPAPAAHGIALYFWIRLGYHPLLRPDWPEERAGFGWMRRDIA